MDITWSVAIVAGVAALVGATVQGGIGFGMNLVTVPALALVLPEALPATVVLIGTPLAADMVRHEHRSVDRSGLSWILIGRVPGTVFGAWVVSVLSVGALKGVIGVSVLGAVAASVFAPPIRLSPRAQLVGGIVSGTTGTAAGIGGPPLALLYQHQPGPTMRSTLAASFLFGTVLSVIFLAIAGEVTRADVGLAAALTPLVIAGSWIGRHTHGALDRGWLRPAVLTFAAVSAVVVLADALL